MVAGFTLAGSPQDIIGQIEQLQANGVGHVTLNEPGPDRLGSVDLLGQEVLPYFQ